MTALVDELLGDAAEHAIYRRLQPLTTPAGRPAPAGWHVDAPLLASGRPPGFQLFILLADLDPGGGGTLVLTSSHRLLNGVGFIKPRDVARRLARESVLRDELDGGCVAGVALAPVQIAGLAGDVFVMDLRCLHSGPPNASARPRVMATHRYLRAGAASEFGGAWGGVPAALRQASLEEPPAAD